MKRFLLIMLAVLCLFAVACGNRNVNEQTTENKSAVTTESDGNNTQTNETTDKTNDKTEATTEDNTENQPACVVMDTTATELKAGDEFTITVKIKNNPGIFSFTFELPIDSNVFEYVGTNTADSICAILGVCDYDNSVSSYKFNGYSDSPFENLTVDGTIVAVTVKVKDNAAAGTYTISAIPDAENIINIEEELVEFVGADISVSVTK